MLLRAWECLRAHTESGEPTLALPPRVERVGRRADHALPQNAPTAGTARGALEMLMNRGCDGTCLSTGKTAQPWAPPRSTWQRLVVTGAREELRVTVSGLITLEYGSYIMTLTLNLLHLLKPTFTCSFIQQSIYGTLICSV